MEVKDLFDIHINGQLELYASNIIEKDNYNILLSDSIDDQYWNFAYLTNNNVDLNEVWKQVKQDMNRYNRIPTLYITSMIDTDKIKETNLECLYTDVWMTNKNLDDFGIYKSKIDMKVSKVNKELKDKFIQAVMDGFSGDNPDDPYENLSEGYKIALERCKEDYKGNYKVVNYLGTYNEESIATATVIYKNEKAIIYNVTTNKKYQKQGVCKQLMSEIIMDLRKLGINTACVQTEQGFYTEQVYKKMGFKEVMFGKAYIEKT